MRLIAPVDSRYSDAAGLIFLDLGRNLCHSVPVETGGRSRRNGFRGGYLVESCLFACTSSQVLKLNLAWPRGEKPRVQVEQVIRRPEWMIGERANADLHHIHYDPTSGRLLVANSHMDCIDYLDLDGRFVERRYLWDVSNEIDSLAYERKEGIADLCHVNHIGMLGDDILLTLGNLNGSRQGVLMSLGSGRMLAQELAFPHDGVQTPEGLWVTEADKGRVTLFKEACTPEDLSSTCSVSTIDVLAQRGAGLEPEGRIWVRGLAFTNDYILVGCSQFDDLGERAVESEPSHIAFVDRGTRQLSGRVYLPSSGHLKRPVIYSIFVMDEEDGQDDIDFSVWATPQVEASVSKERLFNLAEDCADVHSGKGLLLGQIGERLTLDAKLGSGEQCYLRFDREGAFDNLPKIDPERWSLRGAGAIEIECSIIGQGAATAFGVALVVLCYTAVGQVRRHWLTLRTGRNRDVWALPADARSFRLALRVSGTGRCEIEDLTVSKIQN